MAKVSMECKKLMVKELSSQLSGADTIIITHYKGLSAQDLNELRRNLRRIAGDYVVVKDSIAKNALKDGLMHRVSEFIEGEVGIAFYKSDPTIISKTLVQFSKEHEIFKISSGIVGSQVISKEDIVAFASLPSREELLGKLANVLNAPIQGIASSLNGIITKLALALNAIKDKKQE